MPSYKVYYHNNGRIDITPSINKCKFYRIPYHLLENKTHNIQLESKFIVYLLSGKDTDNKDCLYVGTSTKGLEKRPTEHKDKKVDWKNCIVLTSFDNMLNGAIILEIEYLVDERIRETKEYKNTTEKVTNKAVSPDEKELASEVFPTILDVYDMLGVNLKKNIQTTLNSQPNSYTTPQSRKSDFSILKLPSDMIAWLEEAETIILPLDNKLESNVTKSYASIKYPKTSKTVAYFYPNKRKKQIRVLLQGTPELYSDQKITLRPDTMHNGNCKAMFYINGPDDLGYLRAFAAIAIRNCHPTH